MSPVKLVVLALLVGIGSWTLVAAILTHDWLGWVMNLGTELVGAGVIYLIFDQFIGGRERREAKKRELIAQMGSRVRDVAIAATEELRARGGLNDGSLQRARLVSANLQGARLQGADLQGANLLGANLQGAILVRADLQGADLRGAYLQGAFLVSAKLQGAELLYASLQGAKLEYANLQGAELEFARFDEFTTLPDDTNWIPDTDLARFTDPDHPEFWRSDDPSSPAYQPKEQE